MLDSQKSEKTLQKANIGNRILDIGHYILYAFIIFFIVIGVYEGRTIKKWK